MKYPDRQPKGPQSYHQGLTYYDHEKVIQDDGCIASFSFRSDESDKGWVFNCWLDKHGFRIWDDKLRSQMWDETITYQDLLIESEKPMGERWDYVSKDVITDGETLHAYEYGGVLSMRGGFYITTSDNPKKILRSKQTRMS